jgi:hypothetical protein
MFTAIKGKAQFGPERSTWCRIFPLYNSSILHNFPPLLFIYYLLFIIYLFYPLFYPFSPKEFTFFSFLTLFSWVCFTRLQRYDNSRSIFLFYFILFQFCDVAQSGNHTYLCLAKFGENQNMKVLKKNYSTFSFHRQLC